MKTLYILNGKPGSGKSTLADRIVSGKHGVNLTFPSCFKTSEIYPINLFTFCINNAYEIIVLEMPYDFNLSGVYINAAKEAGYSVIDVRLNPC